MVITVAVVVVTHNLAVGVVVGSPAALVVFARRVAHLAEVTAVVNPDGGHVVHAVEAKYAARGKSRADRRAQPAQRPHPRRPVRGADRPPLTPHGFGRPPPMSSVGGGCHSVHDNEFRLRDRGPRRRP
ncbi:hypothetical protein ACWCOT_08895 [Nonomuraea bangladeshensis]